MDIDDEIYATEGVNDVDMDDKPTIQFDENSSVMICGSSKSGKTYWINTFLKNLDKMFTGRPPDEVLYYYMHKQPLYGEMTDTLGDRIIFRQGVPTLEDILEFAKDDDNHRLIVLDDVMHLVVNNDDMSLLFTQLVHHKQLSCIIVYQNLYAKGKHSKTISLNSSYVVLFNNIRDKLQVRYLGSQVFPGKTKVFMKSYTDAMKEPHGYLLIDMTAAINDEYRLRTDIFPGEEMMSYQF